MQAIHRTHESDVVSDVLQLSLAFLEFYVCRNIRNEMFHHCLRLFTIAIAVINSLLPLCSVVNYHEVKSFENYVFL